MLQQSIAVLLVVCCFVYTLWTLAPKAARSRLAIALLKLPLPLVLQKALAAAAKQVGGCGTGGCGGCDRAPKGPVPMSAGPQMPAGYQPLAFVPGNDSKKSPR
jgi:hypothetical protein